MTNNRQSAIIFNIFFKAHLCSGLAQTALQLFSKISFMWKYYEVCIWPLRESRDAEDGCNVTNTTAHCL